MKNKIVNLDEREKLLRAPGLYRTNLAYNKDSMLCHFTMEKGRKLPLHNHPEVQNGFVISGRLRFELGGMDGKVTATAEAGPGCGYVFDANEYHSTEALEDTVFLEHFTPMRPDYIAESEKED